jgi:hypothetical protein
MFRYECHIITEQVEHLTVAIILICDHSFPKSLKKLAIECARISREKLRGADWRFIGCSMWRSLERLLPLPKHVEASGATATCNRNFNIQNNCCGTRSCEECCLESRLWKGYARGRNWFSHVEFLGTPNLLFNRF